MFFGMFLKERVYTEHLDRVAKLYLAYKFFGALFFAYPIFYQFASQTITPVQVGIFFSTIGLVGLAAEIPTGIIADKRGRKSSGLFGVLLLGIAPLIVFFGHTTAAFLIAAIFYGLGRAFLSGALESLVYDHKNVSKAVYRRVNVLEITFGQAGILASAACGGLLFSLHQSLPFVAESVAGVICLGIIAAMRETNKSSYVKTSASGGRHFLQSIQHLFATPYLRAVVLMGVIFSVMLGVCIQFVNEAAMIEHGLRPDTRGFLIACAGVATLIILNIVLLKFLKRDQQRILYLAGGALIAYSLMAADAISLFLAGYFLWSCLNATSSFLRVMVHDQIPSSHRSTIMSNFKALAILVGLGASTATGLLLQSVGTPRAAYVVFAVISCVVLLPCAYWLVGHLKHKESKEATPDSAS